jgi:CRP/FNR family transcriptional regulator
MTRINSYCQTCTVKNCIMLKSFGQEESQVFKPYKHHYELKRGELIFREGDEINGMYFIQSGVIKLEMNAGTARPFILRLAGPGNTMGHRFLNYTGLQPYTATAVEDSRVCFIELGFFKNLMQKNPLLQEEIRKIFIRELRETEVKLLQIAQQTVKEKVAGILLHLAETYQYRQASSGIKVHVDRQEMADLAGTTKEQVSRVLADMDNEQLIRFRAKHFKFMAVDRLREIADRHVAQRVEAVHQEA